MILQYTNHPLIERTLRLPDLLGLSSYGVPGQITLTPEEVIKLSKYPALAKALASIMRKGEEDGPQ